MENVYNLYNHNSGLVRWIIMYMYILSSGKDFQRKQEQIIAKGVLNKMLHAQKIS